MAQKQTVDLAENERSYLAETLTDAQREDLKQEFKLRLEFPGDFIGKEVALKQPYNHEAIREIAISLVNAEMGTDVAPGTRHNGAADWQHYDQREKELYAVANLVAPSPDEHEQRP